MNDIDRSAQSSAPLPFLSADRLAERIADSITDLIFIFDLPSHQLVYLNRALTPMLGYNLTDVLAMSRDELLDHMHPDDMESFVRLGVDFPGLRDGQYVENEMRVRDQQGEWRTLHTRLSAFARGPGDAVQQVMGVVRDVTDLRRMQEALHERERIALALEKERDLSALKNRFMTTVSHEFRTPLSIIMSSAELLERYYDRMTSERRAEAVHTINRQIRHFKQMLDDIWIVLEGDQRSLVFAPRPRDLAAFCKVLADDMFIEGARAWPIQLHTEGDVSSVMFDSDLLGPVLRNLLSNAMKYSTVGSVIRLEVQREAEQIVLRVTDRGIGIRDEDREHIFDTFFRGAGVSHIPGVGLGLKIVRDNLRLHHGTIGVESEIGKGSTFTLRLPLNYPSIVP